MMDQAGDRVPWYRQFWPWFLIALPASAVIAGIATLIIAIETRDGLVVDDYYKAGLAINVTKEREQRARELGLRAVVRLAPDGRRIELELDGRQTGMLDTLEMLLAHPTRADHDQRLILTRTAPNRFEAELAPPMPAHWHIELSPPGRQWRLAGRMRVGHEYQVLIEAVAATEEPAQ
jgi:hypothetical protein